MIMTWIIFAAVWGSIFCFSCMFNDRSLTVAALFGLVLPVIGLIYALIVRRNIKVDPIAGYMENGENAGVLVTIHNRGFFPTPGMLLVLKNEDILFHHASKLRKKLSLAGNSSDTVYLDASTIHCGKMRVRIHRVCVGDPMCFFRFPARIQKSFFDIDRYPEKLVLPVSPVRHNPYAYIAEEEYSTTKPGDDPAEMFGVREYIPGDRQNRIHWNLTAMKDTLMVKELGQPIDTSILLLVDFYKMPEKHTMKLYDGILRTLFGLCNSLLQNGRMVSLAWTDGKGGIFKMKVQSQEEMCTAFSMLFDVTPYDTDRSVVTEYCKAYDKDCFRNVFYVATELPEATEQSMRRIQKDAYIIYCHIVTEKTAWKEEILRDADLYEETVRAGHEAEDLTRNITEWN